MTGRRHTPLRDESVDESRCAVHHRLDILRLIPFLAGLSDADLERLNARFAERGFDPGETVYLEGDPATRLYVVASGKVRLVRYAETGQMVVVDVLVPGDLFGGIADLGGGSEHRESAEAQTAVCVLSLDGRAFQDAVRDHPSVAVLALQWVAGRLEEARDRVHRLSAQDAEGRLAAVLLRLADRVGEDHDGETLIQMPLGRADLAAMAGTTMETASRVVSRLARDGTIRTGRRWVAVRDRHALERMASEGE